MQFLLILEQPKAFSISLHNYTSKTSTLIAFTWPLSFSICNPLLVMITSGIICAKWAGSARNIKWNYKKRTVKNAMISQSDSSVLILFSSSQSSVWRARYNEERNKKKRDAQHCVRRIGKRCSLCITTPCGLLSHAIMGNSLKHCWRKKLGTKSGNEWIGSAASV